MCYKYYYTLSIVYEQLSTYDFNFCITRVRKYFIVKKIVFTPPPQHGFFLNYTIFFEFYIIGCHIGITLWNLSSDIVVLKRHSRWCGRTFGGLLKSFRTASAGRVRPTSFVVILPPELHHQYRGSKCPGQCFLNMSGEIQWRLKYYCYFFPFFGPCKKDRGPFSAGKKK